MRAQEVCSEIWLRGGYIDTQALLLEFDQPSIRAGIKQYAQERWEAREAFGHGTIPLHVRRKQARARWQERYQEAASVWP